MKNLKKLMLILESQGHNALTGSLELEKHNELIKSIFDKKTICYVDYPAFKVDGDGNVIKTEDTAEQFLMAQSRMIKIDDNDFVKNNISASNVYIYKIEKKTEDTILIRLAELNLNKIKKTFTISENVFNEFAQLSDKLAINKSKFVENKIKEFIEKNR